MELVGIGEFGRLSGLSPRALRLYDEVGLLSPARVDSDTGYRWYDAAQTGRARRIVSLRHLGVPLARIAMIVDADPADAARQVESFWRETEFDYQGRRALAGFLVKDLAGEQPERAPVEVRDLRERRLLCLRRNVTAEELVLVGRDFIIRRMREAGVARPTGPVDAPFVIYHGVVTADSDGPVEWCRPVPEDQADRLIATYPDLALRTEPAHQEAYVHRPSARLGEAESWLATQSLAAWAVEHGRQPAEGVRVLILPNRAAGGPSADLAIRLR